MDKESFLKVLIIAVLIYYLVKGALFLLLWQVLMQLEERSRERSEKHRKAVEEIRQRRRERWYNKEKDNDHDLNQKS